MPSQGCFTCGALLDDTCGKDAKGRWLCGPCLDKRGVVDANFALQKDTSDGIRKYQRWEWIALVLALIAAIFFGRRRGWFGRRR